MALRLALLGFGNVGQAFARLLLEKRETLQRDYGLTWTVVGIATARHSIACDQAGLDLHRALLAARAGDSLAPFHQGPALSNSLAFIQACDADVLFELTPLNAESGQPAITHMQTGLRKGQHVITANKGPIAFAYRALRDLAKGQERALRFEGTLLDGAPVFSLVSQVLPASRVLGFRGIVNSTTNFILSRMEEGLSMTDALREAQSLGITEADTDYDVDGWDAAVKTAILINVLMGGDVTPSSIQRSGIRAITTRAVMDAVRIDRRFKLLAQATQQGSGVVGMVAPAMLPTTDPLAHLRGTSNALTLITDTMGELTIVESNPGLAQTAYALLSDLIYVAREHHPAGL
jgi:homoserine dehydrogenase